ncbi:MULTISPECIES: AAA family ATPase [unclassified Acinetobacter]|uniref:AAA family ATPase n=1 Tax=unclassified Acinetobacter TaxID=196816 RepID=UPI002935054D|nr:MULTISPECIES: AAA family ATPase [unclassified Acinetobacter]WOE31111.1 AAA family ATPase [Acinetobacter sp. SAAs470]WOE39307.1 AAA family ATPase [Acinetobacter sp. SAAs474]
MMSHNHAPHIIQPLISNDHSSEKNRLITQPRFHFEPHLVMQHLRQRIIAQDAALKEIENMLHVVKADFSNPDRPLAVTLMLGPTGVGKTETVRLIAEAIYGHADAFCRIDMNTLAQAHYAAALTGAPPGYVGSKEGHSLFDEAAIQGSHTRPGIILFDELEKASPEVIRGLMNVLDTGKLKLTAGTKTLDFRNCMIFMTSNIGAHTAQQYLDKLNFFPAKVQQILLKRFSTENIINNAIQRQFDPEFINRIDRILHYQTILDDALPHLVNIELNKLNQRLMLQKRHIDLSETAKAYFSHQHDIRYGARHLTRKIRVELEPLLAMYFLKHPQQSHCYIDCKNQQLIIKN